MWIKCYIIWINKDVGVRHSINGYLYLRQIRHLWPGGCEEHLGMMNAVAGERSKLELKSCKKGKVWDFQRKCYGNVLGKLFWKWATVREVVGFGGNHKNWTAGRLKGKIQRDIGGKIDLLKISRHIFRFN